MEGKARMAVVLAVSVYMGALFSAGLAQEAAGRAAAPSAGAAAVMKEDAPQESNTTLWGMFRTGGFFMWPLLGLQVAMIALAVYGFMIVPENKMLTPQLLPPLQDAISKLHLDEAMQLCTSTPSMLTNVMHAGLQRISDGVLDVSAMEKAMEEASIEETSAGLKTISYLSIIAQIAPMIGLLGTVSGMIKAFQKIGKGGMGKPEVLAENIGEAMITTFGGLVVGIPAMFLYFYLKSRYTSNVTRLGRVLGNLLHQLVASSRRQADGTETVEESEAAPA